MLKIQTDHGHIKIQEQFGAHEGVFIEVKRQSLWISRDNLVIIRNHLNKLLDANTPPQ